MAIQRFSRWWRWSDPEGDMKTYAKKKHFPLDKIRRFLEPGPVVLARSPTTSPAATNRLGPSAAELP